ncbi:MAG TPA: PDZ domain-containing protein [Thermoleophilia bacterium]|nr:PDZ domain-containing protein [Thermoleophilia bacterium]
MSFALMLLLSGFRLAADAANLDLSPKEGPIGWLGISIQEVGEELAERLAATFGVESGTGVLVVEAIRGGPAEAGGLKPNDVIVKLDNQPIWEVRQLQKIIRGRAPGRPVRLSVLREKERVQVSLAVGQMPEAMLAQLAGERLGFLARARSRASEDKELAGKPEEEVRVMFVEPGSPAAEAGLRPQDLVVRIGDRDIHSLEELGRALRSGKAGDRLSIQIARDGERHIFSLKVPPTDDVPESR